jgi:hypothetical protein
MQSFVFEMRRALEGCGQTAPREDRACYATFKQCVGSSVRVV